MCSVGLCHVHTRSLLCVHTFFLRARRCLRSASASSKLARTCTHESKLFTTTSERLWGATQALFLKTFPSNSNWSKGSLSRAFFFFFCFSVQTPHSINRGTHCPLPYHHPSPKP